MIRDTTFSLSVLFLIIFAFSANSQSSGNNNQIIISSSEITDTTYSCMITTIKGMVYKEVNIFGLSDSSFKILQKDSVKELMIKDVSKIKFYRRGFWKGTRVGIAIGFALVLLAGKGFTTGDGSRKYDIGTAFAVGCILAIPFD